MGLMCLLQQLVTRETIKRTNLLALNVNGETYLGWERNETFLLRGILQLTATCRCAANYKKEIELN